MRAGFDEMLGVKATLDGLEISPHVPQNWNEYSVKRMYRGVLYNISFKRGSEKKIFVDGKEINGNCLKADNRESVKVEVVY